MKALITGITGCVGSHLADYILREHPEVEVHGLIRWRSPRENIAHLPEDRVTFHEGDLRDALALGGVVHGVEPDIIFHLAAQSFVRTSFGSPNDTLQTNAVGTLNLLEVVAAMDDPPVVHLASTSEVYGAAREIPTTENCPLSPINPYAVSKLAADAMCRVYFESYGVHTVRSRAFSHSGPRRSNVFVDSSFAYQIASIEAGLAPPIINVGNLESVRNFCDARDMVEAYWLLADLGEPGDVYNIGGVESCSIRELLDELLDMTRMDIKIAQDPERMRPTDIPVQAPCSEKFFQLTGWTPKISYRQTLLDMLNYWREHFGVS